MADQEPSIKKYRSGVDFIIDEREEIDRDNRKQRLLSSSKVEVKKVKKKKK